MENKYERIKKKVQEYNTIPTDMGGYGSETLMNLKEEFELHQDLVMSMATPILKSNSMPYLKFSDKLQNSFSEIEKLMNDFVPSSEIQKEQRDLLKRKNKVLCEIVNSIGLMGTATIKSQKVCSN